jgi:hypothetical protein
MKLAAEQAFPGYPEYNELRRYGAAIEVQFNGEVQRDVVHADTHRGLLVRYKRDAYRRATAETEELHGRVQIFVDGVERG